MSEVEENFESDETRALVEDFQMAITNIREQIRGNHNCRAR